jgi:hypothetical protein
LERFPGALFDQNGYVLFQNEEEYRKSPQLRIGKKTNVPAGISKLPGYVFRDNATRTKERHGSSS